MPIYNALQQGGNKVTSAWYNKWLTQKVGQQQIVGASHGISWHRIYII